MVKPDHRRYAAVLTRFVALHYRQCYAQAFGVEGRGNG